MKSYQFRTNWRNQLVLQRLVSYRTGYFGDREYAWQDATTQDLKDYYTQLHTLACTCQQQRELFEQQCG